MNLQLKPLVALTTALTLLPGIALGEALPQEQARTAVQAFANALKGELMTAMQAGGNVGMQTMDSALMALVEQARIAGKDAY